MLQIRQTQTNRDTHKRKEKDERRGDTNLEGDITQTRSKGRKQARHSDSSSVSVASDGDSDITVPHMHSGVRYRGRSLCET